MVFDEDDETVRLAHHTVQQFLLQPPTNSSAPGFHFQLEQADVEVGEICVAYLSFSDFERQITISNPQNLLPISAMPGPSAILNRATTTLGLRGVTASMFKFGQIICSGSTRHQLPNFDLGKFAKPRKPPSPNLHEKYRLLDYAVKNWTGHTSNFSEDNTTLWGKFKYLAMDRPMPFDVRAWSDSSVSGDLPYMALFNWAIDAGHVALLKLFLQLPTGSNLHAYCRQSFEEGRSALLNASRRGHEAVVRVLLEAKANVDAKNKHGVTALHCAALNGHEAVVWVLLEAKADVDAKDWNGRTALYRAADKGHEAVVRLLVEAKADVDAKENKHGNMALLRAALNGHEAVVRVLLEAKADVDAKNKHGVTALNCAADEGHKAVVRVLLEAKADVEAKDWNGRTALHRAADKE